MLTLKDLLLLLFLIYIVSIILIIVIDYIRCPKGITLKKFLNGQWIGDEETNNDDYDYYDGLMNFPFVWIPVINLVMIIVYLGCILIEKINYYINKSVFWDIKIK